MPNTILGSQDTEVDPFEIEIPPRSQEWNCWCQFITSGPSGVKYESCPTESKERPKKDVDGARLGVELIKQISKEM